MPSLRELKKRLQSVKTTGQLAGAMRTAATAKYSRASRMLAQSRPYSEAARELYGLSAAAELDSSGPEADDGANGAPPCILLISGNRGLCGGYNHELFSYFANKLMKLDREPVVYACGRMAAEYLSEKHIPCAGCFQLSDIPSFGQAAEISREMYSLVAEGRVRSVEAVYQRFVNMLKQEPSCVRFLPYEAKDEAAEKEPEDAVPSRINEPIFIPDAETVREALIPFCLTYDMYSLLLSCASGAQAATLLAMRSAYDNASLSIKQLETEINRRRQAKVTEGVIETSSSPENHSY